VLRENAVRFALATLALLTVMTHHLQEYYSVPRREPWREAGSVIRQIVEKDSSIIVASNSGRIDYYLQPKVKANVATKPEAAMRLQKIALEKQVRLLYIRAGWFSDAFLLPYFEKFDAISYHNLEIGFYRARPMSPVVQ
jgi:hypothetical protein